MDREQLLKQEIDKIVALGKSKGSVSEDEIMAKLEHLNATAEDMEVVFNALQAENIKVEETIEDDDISLDKSSTAVLTTRSKSTSRTSVKCPS